MKTEIEIWNGGGWNNYQALRTLKTLKAGSRGLASKQGIARIEVSPYDSEKPLGIGARYFDDSGDEIYCHRFDQNDSASWIKERIHALLLEGVQNRINSNAAKAARAAFVNKISAWRRNFDAKPAANTSIEKLSVKFHSARRAALNVNHRPSRGLCTALAAQVVRGNVTYRNAVVQIVAAGGIIQ